jgi:hypothetical protein
LTCVSASPGCSGSLPWPPLQARASSSPGSPRARSWRRWGSPGGWPSNSSGSPRDSWCRCFFVTLGARLEFGALLGSGKALLLLAGLVVAASTVHVLVAIVLRQPIAVGLLATAALGVPSAVVSIGLAQGVLDAGLAAAIVSAVLATIAVSAAGGAILSRDAGPTPR